MISRKLIAIVLLCTVCFPVQAMKRAAGEPSEERPNKRQNSGKPVHEMIEDGDFLEIEEYLNNGGDFNLVDEAGYSVFLSVVYSDELDLDQKTKLLRMLKKCGADVNAQIPIGGTALHYVASMNDLPVAKELINLGLNLRAQDFEGWTPLHFASSFVRGEDMVKLFCSAGARVNARNNDGNTPLHVGAEFADVARSLILYGADPELCNLNDETPYDSSKYEAENKSLKNRQSVRKQIVMPALIPALAPVTLKRENREKTNITSSLFNRQINGFKITGSRLALENESLRASSTELIE